MFKVSCLYPNDCFITRSRFVYERVLYTHLLSMCVCRSVYTAPMYVYTHIYPYIVYIYIFAPFLQRAPFQIQTCSPWYRISNSTKTAFCSKQWSPGVTVPIYLHPTETMGGRDLCPRPLSMGPPIYRNGEWKNTAGWQFPCSEQTLAVTSEAESPTQGDLQHKVRPTFRMLQKYIAVLTADNTLKYGLKCRMLYW